MMLLLGGWRGLFEMEYLEVGGYGREAGRSIGLFVVALTW
jgi:hypothetical protein